MDFNKVIEQFHKKWLRKSSGYIGHPDKTKSLLDKATQMFTKEAFREVLDDLRCLTAYVRDITTGRYKDYSPANLALAIGVLIYVVSPLDVIPDFLVGLGYGDDAFLVGWACRQLHEELVRYRRWVDGGDTPSMDECPS